MTDMQDRQDRQTCKTDMQDRQDRQTYKTKRMFELNNFIKSTREMLIYIKICMNNKPKKKYPDLTNYFFGYVNGYVNGPKPKSK